jgi:uncharacterized protein
MGLRLVPKEENFFQLFKKQAENVVDGARVLVQLLDDYDNRDQLAMKVSGIEHNGDEIAHAVVGKLNTTFITPMDREDIHALASALDDIIDFIHATVLRLAMYNIKEPTDASRKLAGILLRTTEVTCEAVEELENFRKNLASMKKRWIEIHRLENEGDTECRSAIVKLFAEETDAIEVIKWKEIYEHLETAIDKCEDAANITEAAVLKNA